MFHMEHDPLIYFVAMKNVSRGIFEVIFVINVVCSPWNIRVDSHNVTRNVPRGTLQKNSARLEKYHLNELIYLHDVLFLVEQVTLNIGYIYA